jgi:hypothetical protein
MNTQGTQPPDGIVADGPWRLLKARQKERVAVRLAVRHRHADELGKASLLRQLLLEWKILWEIRAEMLRRFPPRTPHTLHVTPLSRYDTIRSVPRTRPARRATKVDLLTALRAD